MSWTSSCDLKARNTRFMWVAKWSSFFFSKKPKPEFCDFLNKLPKKREGFLVSSFSRKMVCFFVLWSVLFLGFPWRVNPWPDLIFLGPVMWGGSKLLKFVGGFSHWSGVSRGRKKDDCSSTVVVVHIFQKSILRKPPESSLLRMSFQTNILLTKSFPPKKTAQRFVC